ncbi:MAG TPA: hypothetical protein VE201_05905, partial [Nitrospirales bacterium]|nr:hypothetical protein [Nitrospirales bacterium]
RRLQLARVTIGDDPGRWLPEVAVVPPVRDPRADHGDAIVASPSPQIDRTVTAHARLQNNPGDRFLTAKQVGERLGRSVNWVYENDLPFIIRQAGRRPRYSERGLERWMAAMQDDFGKSQARPPLSRGVQPTGAGSH